MTITATHIGTSTVQITNYWEPSSGADNLHSFDAFAASIADAITGTANGSAGTLSGITFTSASGITFQSSTGWTLAGSFWGYTTKVTSRGISPLYTQVFKCLCADGNSTKNLILRYNTVTQELLTTTCEKYDVATRTITNEAYTFYDCAPIHYNLTYSDIIIMVHPRYLILHSYVAGESTLWAGVVESNREDALDVASSGYPDTVGSTGFPCWGWISSVSWGIGSIAVDGKVLGNATTATGSGPLWSMPRTATGATGVAAAVSYSCDLGIESYPNPQSTGSNLMAMNRFIESNIRFTRTGWSVNKLLMPIKPIFDFANTSGGVTNYGQIYGLKVLSALGYNMNQIDVPVDSDLNANAIGTVRRHWLLNTHQKTITSASYKDGNYWTSDMYTLAGKAMRHVSVGSAIYVLVGTGRGTGVLYKINRFTRVVELLTFTNNSSLVDIAYDGERYIYITRGSTTAALQRLDIADNSVVVINGSVSYGVLALNGNTVNVAEYAAATTSNPILRFNRLPFSSPNNTAITATSTSSSVSLGTGTAGTSVFKLTTDFDGSILGATTSNTVILYKIDYSTLTASTFINFSTTSVVDWLLLDGKTLYTYNGVAGSTFGVNLFYQYPLTTAHNFATGTTKSLGVKGSFCTLKYQGVLYTETTDVSLSLIVTQPNANYLSATNPLTAASVLPALTVTTRAFPGTSFDFGNISAKFYGSEFMGTIDTGLQIYANLNGYATIGSGVTGASTKLCQVAIPA